jgi:formyltetrahydrofolate deformylase
MLRGLPTVGERFAMRYRLCLPEGQGSRKRVAIFVSEYDHCLYDLLLRHRAAELRCDLVAVISNHATLGEVAEQFKVPFFHFPKTKQTKHEVEQKELDFLKSQSVDLVVLARYMQILSGGFIASFPERIINIHHSFLPAFVGGRPYHQAHERGVKLIGATAHYATEILDEGPIIEQDVVRCSHRDSVEDLVRKGRDLEKVVLARAVRSHLEDRVLTYANKTVVFG